MGEPTLPKPRSRIWLLALLLLFLSSFSNAQEIDWSAARFSAAAQWLFPQKEFGAYWNSGPGAGIIAEVPIANGIDLTGLGNLSWHNAAETPRKAKIPQILLLKLGIGLQFQNTLGSDLEYTLASTIVNNTFIFTGPAAPGDIDNIFESEWGIAFSLRLALYHEDVPGPGIIAMYEPVFTGPDPVALISLGIVIPLF